MALRDLHDPELHHLMTLVQDGVVSRAQLLACGASDDDIDRLLRRRELSRWCPGVYVDHTGPLSPEQRRWAAVLAHAPAALTLTSALPSPPTTGPVHVAIDSRRSVRALPGVVAHRTHHLADRIAPGSAPPRVRVEHAVIDLAAASLVASDVPRAFRVLADAAQSRRTTPTQIAAVLSERVRVPRRALLAALLEDLATGASSVLEREYVRAVERPHGLPQARRQTPGPLTSTGRATYRDLRYAAYGVVVELDGRAFHDNAAARDADHERDLYAAAADGDLTVRLTYGQVFERGCQTAAAITRILRRRGRPDDPVRCPACPR